ncbi:Signal recognition particle subunit SRP68 [Smittium culicis]|uniref:Signal recognition particle subunit SRP68 n=1 Tax=Smittium culicis TaxID=133412 RepID=A0A1R1YMW9_9FUNG|nr:Signal recognition particle subunit SRP68 [Smittium culicis]
MSDITLDFNVLELITNFRAANGYDSRNFDKYSKAVSNALKNLRQLLDDSKKPAKNAKAKKKTKAALPQLTENEKFCKKIQLHLFEFEKARTKAKLLEELYSKTEEPRQRYHMIRRLAKATKIGSSLLSLIDSAINPLNFLLAAVFVAETEAESLFKQEIYHNALYLFSFVRQISSTLKSSSSLSINQASSLDNCLNENVPFIRFSAYNLELDASSLDNCLNENVPFIRFSAYNLELDGARSTPIYELCQTFLSNSKTVNDFKFGSTEKISLALQSFADSPKSTSSDSTSSSSPTTGLTITGFDFSTSNLLFLNSFNNASNALTSQNSLLESLQSASSNSIQDIDNLFDPVISNWKHAISEIKQSKSEIKSPAIKYAQFCINNLFCLKFHLASQLTKSTNSDFASLDNWFALSPELLTQISLLFLNLVSKNSSAPKPSKISDLQSASGLSILSVYFDNIYYHSNLLLSNIAKNNFLAEFSATEFNCSFFSASRDLAISLYNLSSINHSSFDHSAITKSLLSAKSHAENASTILSQLSNNSSYKSSKSIQCFISSSHSHLLPQIISTVENLLIISQSHCVAYNKIQSASDFSSIVPSLLDYPTKPIASKPIFYDLASDFIDFDIASISKKANISNSSSSSDKKSSKSQTSQQDNNTSTISSIFSSFLGRK